MMALMVALEGMCAVDVKTAFTPLFVHWGTAVYKGVGCEFLPAISLTYEIFFYSNERLLLKAFPVTLKTVGNQAPVAQAYNPSYLGG
jgi:hypothetical protein